MPFAEQVTRQHFVHLLEGVTYIRCHTFLNENL